MIVGTTNASDRSEESLGVKEVSGRESDVRTTLVQAGVTQARGDVAALPFNVSSGYQGRG